MKNKLKIFITVFAIIFIVTGCGIGNNNSGSNEQSNSNAKINGNCHALDCIKQIEIENTVDEINKIIGFDGVLQDEKYNIYYWEISETEGIKAAYYSSKTATITADYDRNTLANNKVDFSRYDELQTKIKEGISYNDFISYIGNVQGTIVEKSSITTKYVWEDSNGSYLQGSFSNSSNQCTFVSGRV